MKILVTGATGFVGQHVVPELLRRGHQVVATGRDSAKAAAMPWISGVEFVPCDLHDAALNPVDKLGVPDAVIHLAWSDLPNYGSLFHFETNLPASYRFLKAMIVAGTTQVLVTGTCFEYGMRDGQLAEDATADPATFYALAKDTLRRFLQALQTEHSFVLQWARLFYLYGPGQHPNSLLAQLQRAIARGEAVFDMSGGEQLRDYLPVEEVAHQLAILVERPACDGIINCCSGKPISVRRLVEGWIRVNQWSIELHLHHHPYAEYEPMAFWGDRSKLSRCLEMENGHESGH